MAPYAGAQLLVAEKLLMYALSIIQPKEGGGLWGYVRVGIYNAATAPER